MENVVLVHRGLKNQVISTLHSGRPFSALGVVQNIILQSLGVRTPSVCRTPVWSLGYSGRVEESAVP